MMGHGKSPLTFGNREKNSVPIFVDWSSRRMWQFPWWLAGIIFITDFSWGQFILLDYLTNRPPFFCSRLVPKSPRDSVISDPKCPNIVTLPWHPVTRFPWQWHITSAPAISSYLISRRLEGGRNIYSANKDCISHFLCQLLLLNYACSDFCSGQLKNNSLKLKPIPPSW